MTMQMENGSIACVHYTSVGDTGVEKEYIEVSSEGRTAIIHDFRRVDLWVNQKKSCIKYRKAEKGQPEQIAAWIRGLRDGQSPMRIDDVLNVHAACLAAVRSLTTGKAVNLESSGLLPSAGQA